MRKKNKNKDTKGLGFKRPDIQMNEKVEDRVLDFGSKRH